MTRRRGRGEGSVYRRTDGLWASTVTAGYDANGKRRRRYLYAKTKHEVLEKLAQLQSKALAGALGDPERLRLSDYLTAGADGAHGLLSGAVWSVDASPRNRLRGQAQSLQITSGEQVLGASGNRSRRRDRRTCVAGDAVWRAARVFGRDSPRGTSQCSPDLHRGRRLSSVVLQAHGLSGRWTCPNAWPASYSEGACCGSCALLRSCSAGSARR
jgi:hypothetical protein